MIAMIFGRSPLKAVVVVDTCAMHKAHTRNWAQQVAAGQSIFGYIGSLGESKFFQIEKVWAIYAVGKAFVTVG
jgi:hypothetical protein